MSDGAWLWWVLGLVLVWGGLVWLTRWFEAVPLRGRDEFLMQGMFRLAQVWTRVIHRVRFEGLEHVPARNGRTHAVAGKENAHGEPPIIVAPNHTAGIDPVVVQVACGFEIRWMMAADMRAPELEWAWEYLRIVFVDRGTPDSGALKEALRHLRAGGALGIFPEGHLERPPRHLLEFKEGIGVLAKRTGAIVLPVVIDGTPAVDPAWGSLLRPSRTVVRFLEPVTYAKEWTAESICQDLRRRMQEATGWPDSPTPAIEIDGALYSFGMDGRYHDSSAWEAEVPPEVASRIEAERIAIVGRPVPPDLLPTDQT